MNKEEEKKVLPGQDEEDEEEELEEEEEDEEEQPTMVDNTVKPYGEIKQSQEDKKSLLAQIIQGSPKALANLINRKALDKQ